MCEFEPGTGPHFGLRMGAHCCQSCTVVPLPRSRIVAADRPLRSIARRFGPGEIQQLVGTVSDTERRPVWLQGGAGIERPDSNRVESESIDELQDRCDRVRVIAGRSQGEAIRRAGRTPPLLKLEVAEVVETLYHS